MYIEIHQHRKQNKIIYNAEIDPNCFDVLVPKLFMQPIIENSIKYGLTKNNNLTLNLRVAKKGKLFIVDIEDDGGGIDSDTLVSINENLKKQIEELLAKNKELESKKGGGEQKGFSIPSEGTFYVVQIGAFQQRDVEVNQNNPDFRKENNDGFNKYVMGVFESADKADDLRKFLTQIDFRRNPTYRPFIAPYKDGKRISLEEAVGAEEAKKYKK
jgi:hypothetical protein